MSSPAFERAEPATPTPTLAFDVYIHRLRHGIVAMLALLVGINVLAFTGGVDQHLSDVRRATVDRLTDLGLAIDPQQKRRRNLRRRHHQ